MTAQTDAPRTMKYLILFYRHEAHFAGLSDEARANLRERYMQYGMEVMRTGQVLAGEKLQPTETATYVRMKDQKRQVTDGPFAETTEQIAGFMLMECKDLDEALDWAARHPDAEHGLVEVRPVELWTPPSV